MRQNDTATLPTTTRQVVVHRAGGHDRLILEDRPTPEPGPGEVRIAVGAIGVNFGDVMVRMGLYRKAGGFPNTPGFEVAGIVEATGEGVDDLPIGTRVAAVTLFGGYASRIVVGRPYVFEIPDSMTIEEAAAFPSVYLTAYFATHGLSHPRPGEVALVHSAAGGVGGALVQLLGAAGVRVAAVVGGEHKIEVARAHGAEWVIDRKAGDLWTALEAIAPDGFDLVYDANGVSTLGRSYRCLRPAGRLVIYGFSSMTPAGGRVRWLRLALDFLRTPRFSPFDMVEESRSVLAFNLSGLFDRTEILAEAVDRLLTWHAEGLLSTPPITRFDLDRVADAHRAIESGRTVGKLVLIP